MVNVLPYGIILISILLDQLTKIIVQSLIVVPYQVTCFFNLVSVYNRGVSFGFLNGKAISPWFFIGFTICICIGLFLWLKREKEYWPRIFLGLIIGGALGNMIDRLVKGAVFDFLDFHLGIYHWPAFNVADSCIVVGVILLFFHNLSTTKHHR